MLAPHAATSPPWRFMVLALLLGIGVAHSRAWSQEGNADADKAIAEIQKLGGKVDRDEKAEGKPVITVNFGTTSVDDSALVHVEGLKSLKKLTLNGTKVTDAGLEHLKGLMSLEKLYLVDTKISDAGLEQLKDLANLKVLSLVGTEVGDAGLEHLKGLSNLQDLFLFGSKVTEDGAKKLKEALPKVKIDR